MNLNENIQNVAKSGYRSESSISDDCSTSSVSGSYSKSTISGAFTSSSCSGNRSESSSSGYHSTSTSSGYHSTSSSSGNYSKSASSGDYSKSASSDEFSCASAIGYRAAVKGDLGNLLMASEYIRKDELCIPVGGKADIVDGKLLKPECWYIVEKGEWVEVEEGEI